MSIRVLTCVCVVFAFVWIGCVAERRSDEWTVSSPSDEQLVGIPVKIPTSELTVPLETAVQVLVNDMEVPSQADDLDSDGVDDELFFLLDLPPDASADISVESVDVTKVYDKRTQALLAVRDSGRFGDTGLYVDGTEYRPVHRVTVPVEQEQDSDWAMFEGPVWESDLVGYRFYLDDRNRTDVFGKSVPRPVLHEVEGDYHAVSEWGADVLKVGESLGLGSPAAYLDSGPAVIDNATGRTVEIVADGPLRSILRTTYEGWEVDGRVIDVVSDMEVHAGQRWTEQTLSLSGDIEGLRFATGIVRHPEAAVAVTGEESGVFYLYTWGRQSDQGHDLGMAILVREAYQPVHDDNDPLSHLVLFTPEDNQVAYRFLAAWELEPDPITDAAGFEEAIRSVARSWTAAVDMTAN
jgi:hypothetical protein